MADDLERILSALGDDQVADEPDANDNVDPRDNLGSIYGDVRESQRSVAPSRRIAASPQRPSTPPSPQRSPSQRMMLPENFGSASPPREGDAFIVPDILPASPVRKAPAAPLPSPERTFSRSRSSESRFSVLSDEEELEEAQEEMEIDMSRRFGLRSRLPSSLSSSRQTRSPVSEARQTSDEMRMESSRRFGDRDTFTGRRGHHSNNPNGPNHPPDGCRSCRASMDYLESELPHLFSRRSPSVDEVMNQGTRKSRALRGLDEGYSFVYDGNNYFIINNQFVSSDDYRRFVIQVLN